MDCTLIRDHMDATPTTGQLYAGDIDLYTLERPWVDNARGSCIPTGDYRLVIAWSNRYQKLMPRLLNVPGRSGILVHPGNTTADTFGCILVGSVANGNVLHWSRRAFEIFYDWLGRELREGDVRMIIRANGED